MAECLCKIKSNAIDVLAWFIHMGIQAIEIRFVFMRHLS
jgi:hypothetical protein